MRSDAVEQRQTELWETPKSVYGWFASVDHKNLGLRYLVTAMVFLMIGGVEALLMRIQLSRADQALIMPEMCHQIFSMHGITMIFWYASPILTGFSVYLIPLMIGARDIAFP
jgi:heme/copper-type cytochrome/quinol oxidase subunit 1